MGRRARVSTRRYAARGAIAGSGRARSRARSRASRGSRARFVERRERANERTNERTNERANERTRERTRGMSEISPLASPRAEANGERERGAPRHERSLSESLESAQTSAWAREAGRGGSDKGRETSARQGLPPTVIGAPAHHARARSYSQADAHEPSLRTVLEEPRGANGGTTTEEEKRERRMQANRLSAAKSRMKKMRRMVELEQTCEETLTRVNALSAEVEALRAEYEELRARNEELTSTLSTPRGPHLDSASKEFLQSLSGVDGSFTGMTIDAKGDDDEAFAETLNIARASSMERLFDSDGFFVSSPRMDE